MPPRDKLKTTNPKNPTNTPMIFFDWIFALKNKIEIRITNRGVRELRIAAIELFIFFSMAIAKRNAGNKLPRKPVNITKGSLPTGISRM